MTGRHIIIGDIHGCFAELQELLKLVEARVNDHVFHVGDLVDRGPESAEVVKYCKMLGIRGVLGNHCEKHLRHRRHMIKKGRSPVQLSAQARVLHEQLSEEDWEYLEALPYWLKLTPTLAIVHAGVQRGLALPDQDKDTLLRMRFCDRDTGEMVSMKREGEDFLRPATSAFWTELWTGPESIVYGHYVQHNGGPGVDEPVPGVFCYGIDTGCCFGKNLTAAIFEDLSKPPVFASVPSKGAYAKLYNEGTYDDGES